MCHAHRELGETKVAPDLVNPQDFREVEERHVRQVETHLSGNIETPLEANEAGEHATVGFSVGGDPRPAVGSHHLLLLGEVLAKLLDQEARPSPSRSQVPFPHRPAKVPEAEFDARVRVVESWKTCRRESHICPLMEGHEFCNGGPILLMFSASMAPEFELARPPGGTTGSGTVALRPATRSDTDASADVVLGTYTNQTIANGSTLTVTLVPAALDLKMNYEIL